MGAQSRLHVLLRQHRPLVPPLRGFAQDAEVAEGVLSYSFSLRGRKGINPSPSGRVITNQTGSGTHGIIDSIDREAF